MNVKIFREVTDSLRDGSPLSSEGALELALKLIVWAKLSGDPSASPVDPARMREVLAASGFDAGLLSQALPDDPGSRRQDLQMLQSALNPLLRLRDQGLLETFDPVEVIAALFPSASHPLGLPLEVVDFLANLGGGSSRESIYAPWDALGQLAHRSAAHAAPVYVESPMRSAIPALVSLLSARPFEIHYHDPIRDPSAVEAGRLRKFDVAIAFPPINFRYDAKDIARDLFERFPERTTSGAVLAVRHMLAQARRRVVVAIPNTLLFSIGGEQALRQDLLRSGKLEAVVSMPAGLLAWANIAFAVLVLDPAGGRQAVRFVNADSPRFRETVSKAKTRLTDVPALIAEIAGIDETAESKTVTVREILANDAQLQVDRYVLPISKKRLAAFMAGAQTLQLGELVTLIRAVKTVSGDSEGLSGREVGVADLPEHGYIGTPAREVRLDPTLSAKAKQQFLHPHDIVLTIKGSVGKIGLVPPDVPPAGDGGWVAGGSFITLRLVDPHQIDPRALFVLLRSPVGRALLEGISSGAAIPLIQLKELNRLELPVPNPDTARRAVAAFEREIELQRQIEQLKGQQAGLFAGLWTLEPYEEQA